MIKDDWLLRQIAEMVEGLAGIRQEIHDRVDLDASVVALDTIARQLTGMSLGALDRLPPSAIASAVPEPTSRRALAEVLRLAAQIALSQGDVALAEARLAKAEAIC